MYKQFFLYLFFICIYFFPATATVQVIYVLGPSCAGKTTTAIQLATELGESWKLVEYDLLEEQIGRRNASEEFIFSQTINEAHQHLANGYNVIIDTNTFFKPLCTLSQAGYNILNVYIYAPLKILLKRYEKRRKKYHYSKHRAKWIKKFIAHTFHTLYPKGIPEKSGLVIDTTKVSLHEAVDMIKTTLAAANTQ